MARPYKVDGLLEAVVERLHTVLDNRNTAAIFNAAAMAARRLLSPYLHMTNNRLGATLSDEAYLAYALARALREGQS